MRELLALVVENVGRRWQEWRDQQRRDRQMLVVDIGERFVDRGATIAVRRAWRWTAAARPRDHRTLGTWLLRVDAWRRRN